MQFERKVGLGKTSFVLQIIDKNMSYHTGGVDGGQKRAKKCDVYFEWPLKRVKRWGQTLSKFI